MYLAQKTIKKYISLAIIIALSLSPYLGERAIAAENSFQVNVAVVGSSLPTPPTDLSASAISQNQINLSWQAGTAGAGIDYYNIYRDGSLIGTSITTSFSDPDLESGRLYEYRVSTVDSVSNESVLSDSALATTFTPDTGGGGSQLIIHSLNIVTQPFSAVLIWKTNRDSLGQVYWGKTKDYELGSISGKLYQLNHQVRVPNLSPDTLYYVKIVSTNPSGKQAIIETEFRTKFIPDLDPPSNPINFIAVPTDSSVKLSWDNPPDKDFREVRIVRSDKFYPRDIADGKVVYQGSRESFEDEDVVTGMTYYYTIFSVDKSNNYSSGAIAHARVPLDGETPVQTPFVYDSLPKSPLIDPAIEILSLLDFDFIQFDRKIMPQGEKIPLDGREPFTIFLTYEKVPEILKTISITLYDPQNPSKVFSFLLRVNKNKTGYEATIAPLGKSGDYMMQISILDYKNQGLKKIDGSLLASVGSLNFPLWDEIFSKWIIIFSEYFWLLILLIILTARYVWKKIRKKKQEIRDKKLEKREEVYEIRD